MHFSEQLAHIVQKKSPLLLGLDPAPERLPSPLKQAYNSTKNTAEKAEILAAFCEEIMQETADFVAGIKIQTAYFEALGHRGVGAMRHVIATAQQQDLWILIDAKRGDIDVTAQAYAEAYLGNGPLAGDALTINPLLGSDTVQPFINVAEKNNRGIFVLVKTSNPSASEFQNNIADDIAKAVTHWGESSIDSTGFSSVGAVIGATRAEEIAHFRSLMPTSWFLCPGIGAQGGDLLATLTAAQKNNTGVLIPISRGILYASNGNDYRAAARISAGKYYKIMSGKP